MIVAEFLGKSASEPRSEIEVGVVFEVVVVFEAVVEFSCCLSSSARAPTSA